LVLYTVLPGKTGYPSKTFSSVKTMLSFHSLAKKLLIILPAFSGIPQGMLDAAPVSYAPQILQYVSEDKVYLLENIRKNITIPSEKLVADALLAEDGPQAAYLYRKQLGDYPDPSLDDLSRSRLSAFQFALNQPIAFPEVVPKIAVTPATGKTASPVKPKEVPVQAKPSAPATAAVPKPVMARGMYTLQFGSFGNRANAEKLAAELSGYGPVSIVQDDGMHKVRLQKSWQTEEDAERAGSSIPFGSIAVPLR